MYVSSSPAWQLVGPVGNGDFISADFMALEIYELRKRADPVIAALEEIVPLGERDRFVAHLTSSSQSLIVHLELLMQS